LVLGGDDGCAAAASSSTAHAVQCKRRLKSRARVCAGWERTVEGLGVKRRCGDELLRLGEFGSWDSGGWKMLGDGTFCACSGTLFDSARGRGPMPHCVVVSRPGPIL
jgi:hypothetical protein